MNNKVTERRILTQIGNGGSLRLGDAALLSLVADELFWLHGSGGNQRNRSEN